MFDSSELKCYNNSIVFLELKKMKAYTNSAVFFSYYYFFIEK